MTASVHTVRYATLVYTPSWLARILGRQHTERSVCLLRVPGGEQWHYANDERRVTGAELAAIERALAARAIGQRNAELQRGTYP